MAREGFEPPPDHHQYDLCNMCLCDILISLSNFESEIFAQFSRPKQALYYTRELPTTSSDNQCLSVSRFESQTGC